MPKSSAPFVPQPLTILGAGAVGLFLAAGVRVAFPNYPLRVLMREELFVSRMDGQVVTVCLQQSRGPSTLVDADARHNARLVHIPARTVTRVCATPRPKKPVQNLILTTKAFQAKAALESVRSILALRRDTTDDKPTAVTNIVWLGNGALAVRDELESYLAQAVNDQASHLACTLHLGILTHGVYRLRGDDMETVVHAGQGQIVLSNHKTAFLAELWDRAGLNTTTVDQAELERLLWYKLAANCVINPLTALYAVSNGNVADRVPDFNHTMRSIVDEIVTVQNAMVGTVRNSEPLEAEAVEAFVHQVMRETARNQSSMWRDVQASRQTEIDYLNGYVVRQGQAWGIPCPVNEKLVNAIRKLQPPSLPNTPL